MRQASVLALGLHPVHGRFNGSGGGWGNNENSLDASPSLKGEKEWAAEEFSPIFRKMKRVFRSRWFQARPKEVCAVAGPSSIPPLLFGCHYCFRHDCFSIGPFFPSPPRQKKIVYRVHLHETSNSETELSGCRGNDTTSPTLSLPLLLASISLRFSLPLVPSYLPLFPLQNVEKNGEWSRRIDTFSNISKRIQPHSSTLSTPPPPCVPHSFTPFSRCAFSINYLSATSLFS